MCNVGFALILMVGPEHVDAVQASLRERGEASYHVGEVVAGNKEIRF